MYKVKLSQRYNHIYLTFNTFDEIEGFLKTLNCVEKEVKVYIDLEEEKEE